MLSGYRVLDLTDEKGMMCGKTLADLGMDVIKIEKPGGDPVRRIGPYYHDVPDPEKSLFWFTNNLNKRGVTLDIETTEGQEILKKLVATADFVIESSFPGYMADLGLEYEALSKINPRIIMTSITPFGQKGPYSRYKASDITTMAMGGLMYITGDTNRSPLRISTEQACFHAGLQAAAGTMIAHHYRELSGEGQHVDVSMQESIVVTLWTAINSWKMNKVIQERQGQRRRRYSIDERVSYPCKDGSIAWELLLGPLGNSTFKLVEFMNEQGFADDLKLINWKEIHIDDVDQEQWQEWEEIFAKFFLTRTKTDLHEEAIKRGILLMPVNNIRDIVEDKHLADRDFWIKIEHTELGETLTYPKSPFQQSEISRNMPRRAPFIGEHNQEVYQEELGIPKEDIMILKQSNVI